MLLSIIDRVITKYDPIGLLRAHREKIIILNKQLPNELGIIKNAINSFNKTNIYFYNFYNSSIAIPNPNVHQKDFLREIKSQYTMNISQDTMNLIKTLTKENTFDINRKYLNVYVSTQDVTNIDILRYKCENNYYMSKDSFCKDVNHLFTYIKINLKNGFVSKDKFRYIFAYEKYLGIVYEEMIKLLLRTPLEDTFESDLTEMLQLNNFEFVHV